MADSNGNGQAANGVTAPSIDQVRELIFGSEQRKFEGDIDALRKEMTSMEARLSDKIDALTKALDRADAAQNGQHRATLDALGSAITALGQEVGSLADRS